MPTVTRTSVSLCRGSGHVGMGVTVLPWGCRKDPPSGEGVLTVGA